MRHYIGSNLNRIYYICDQEEIAIHTLIEGAEEKFGLLMEERDIVARMVGIIQTQQTYILPFLLHTQDLTRVRKFVENLV